MAHRTQLSQAEEALRQVDTDPATLRTLMERIAQWISFENPGAPITPLGIDDLAAQHTWTHLKRTSHLGRVDRARHTALQAALMAALPGPRDDEHDGQNRPAETRGEYALRIRATARA
ncbi:hypothetical protein [Streptomyces xanthophaeus]|uniref:hypothetical protein n=1 Tax=Streptomyces xanthophaeus TaxID=67385 RepID=UPI0026470E19|nr:hypothetical protein [Streptomyces xanthophaeus]WKD36524.1 hypothetical protein KO717_34385 [Streptomyces xanthophaeus]